MDERTPPLQVLDECSRSLGEFLLLPSLTTPACTPDRIDLTTPIVRHRLDERPALSLATPLTSAIMQAVSAPRLAIALARCGGISFLHHNQSIEDQAQAVRAVKTHRDGFRTVDAALRVGAGINTHDDERRLPALVDAGADILCIDSSDGYSTWQADTIRHAKATAPETSIGAGNVVDHRGFRYLADAGADFVKVGIGGGSICITRDQKGIGRGQADALIDVVTERDRYAAETGDYVPICCDGGVLLDHHMSIALALGADFIMLGRYFARFDESPGRQVDLDGRPAKEYWAEGSRRAHNAARYDQGHRAALEFEEGVDGYVPYAGSLSEGVRTTLTKLRATLASCGSANLREFHDRAVLAPISPLTSTQSTYDIEV